MKKTQHSSSSKRKIVIGGGVTLVILIAFPFVLSAHGVGELYSFLKYLFLQGAGLFIALLAFLFLLTHLAWKLHGKKMAASFALFLFGIGVFTFVTFGLPNGLQFPAFQQSFGPGDGPTLPLVNVFKFFQTMDEFERVPDIAQNPDVTGVAHGARIGKVVEVSLETKEVLSEMAPDIAFNYWTFNGQVPGPFVRATVGDTVKLTLTNSLSSLHHHNIDLHAVTGPGGGAVVTTVAPGDTKSFSFKALHPGLYVYHCAVANVPSHMAHGMYGMILIEPEGGLPSVDKEFYVMQGEFYSTGKLGKKGLQIFDAQKMLDGRPEYVVFNGRTGGLAGKMEAKVGDKVRIYFGNGGVNLISSFHVIGEVFDTVYPEGAIDDNAHHHVQTTSVPAGGATIVEFGVEYPGNYILVDHALARLDKGAWGVLTVKGEKDPEVFDGDFSGAATSGH